VGTILWEIGLILLITNVPFLRESFNLAPVGIYEIILIAGLSAIVLLTIEVTKFLLHFREAKKEVDLTEPSDAKDIAGPIFS